MPYSALLHTHVTSWTVALILFAVSLLLLRAGKDKALKGLQMVLRLFYILILLTGIYLLFQINFQASFILKAVLAVWLIYVMEKILTLASKGVLDGKMKAVYGIQFGALLILVLLLGYRVIGI